MFVINHLLNFIAPALWLAAFLPAACRLLWRRAPARLPLIEQAGIQLVVGVLVLLAGLVVLGRDGATATYAGLVSASALAQWWMLR